MPPGPGFGSLIGVPARELGAGNRRLRTVLENESGEGSFKFEVDGKETLFKFETAEIHVPNIASLKFDELNIARLPAGKIYLLRNIGEMHEI